MTSLYPSTAVDRPDLARQAVALPLSFPCWFSFPFPLSLPSADFTEAVL